MELFEWSAVVAKTTMTATWRDQPVVPESHDDVAALAKVARKARRQIVEFEWELTDEHVRRLREAVCAWGAGVQGRYKKFDAEVLVAINDALGEPDSAFTLAPPKGSAGVDSAVAVERVGERYQLTGHASFDVVFGYARGGIDDKYRLRLGPELADLLREIITPLGWDVAALSSPDLRPALNALYGLPPDYNIEIPEQPPAPTETLELKLHGPVHWDQNQGLPWLYDHPVAGDNGIYLWTIPVGDVEYVHYVGQTRRGFVTRLTEHLAAQLAGRYTILDAEALAQGEQQIVWRAPSGLAGYGSALTDFVERREELVPKLAALLKLFRYHLLPVDGDARLIDRIAGTLGRHFQEHQDDRVRAYFGLGARFPAAIPFEKSTLCKLSAEATIAGLPEGNRSGPRRDG